MSTCMLQDRHALRRKFREAMALAKNPADAGDKAKAQRLLAEIKQKTGSSQQKYNARLANLPKPSYPMELPVSGKKEQIAAAIRQHQVVIVCGETGSGKTTQLPKICLELGRGVAGLIGHTQPRRIAARSVASRIAQELQSPLGEAVGYKVRFNDKLSESSYIKLMTDGILLAETQGDHFLNAYDTIIIDEAHEFMDRTTQAVTEELTSARVMRAAAMARKYMPGKLADAFTNAADSFYDAMNDYGDDVKGDVVAVARPTHEREGHVLGECEQKQEQVGDHGQAALRWVWLYWLMLC